MKYGYARVSTIEQNLDVQIDKLRAAGCDVIRAEKVSGTSREGRAELEILLQFMRSGDELNLSLETTQKRKTASQRGVCAGKIGLDETRRCIWEDWRASQPTRDKTWKVIEVFFVTPKFPCPYPQEYKKCLPR